MMEHLSKIEKPFDELESDQFAIEVQCKSCHSFSVLLGHDAHHEELYIVCEDCEARTWLGFGSTSDFIVGDKKGAAKNAQ